MRSANILVHDVLRAERYDLSSDYASLDRRLMREVGRDREAALRAIWAETDEVRRLSAFYNFPRTAREAHLLFSHDRRRIIDSFRWVLSKQPFDGPIVDSGTEALSPLAPSILWQ
jgi:hypothetical protein